MPTYNLDSIDDLLDTPEVCPLCGHSPDETWGCSGLNATLCEPCAEHIHLLTPGFATLTVASDTRDVYHYSPVADQWRDTETADRAPPVVFLDPAPADQTALSNEMQALLMAYLTGEYRTLLSQVPEDKLASAKARKPQPAVELPKKMYVPDIESLESTTSAGEQETLAGF